MTNTDKQQIVQFVKDVRQEHDTRIAATYVAKESGKSLMLDTDKTKLDGIETGAEANVIEGVSIVGGAALPIDSSTKIASLDLSNYALKSDVGGVFKPKGSVDTFAQLPTTGNVSGDVWNVKIAGGTDRYGTPVKAGDNVLYIEADANDSLASGWDVMGGTTDLSDYVQTVSGKSLIYDSLISGVETFLANNNETFSSSDIADIFTD